MRASILNIVNQPGSLRKALDVLHQKSINLNFLAAWRTGEGYGVICLLPETEEDITKIHRSRTSKLGVSDPFAINVIKIIYTDQLGALTEVLEPIAKQEISIDFCFSYSIENKQAIAIIGVPERRNEEAIQILQGLTTVINVS
jgi:hypothetical protein